MPGQNAPEFTVSEISGEVKRTLEGTFGRIRVKGEVGPTAKVFYAKPIEDPGFLHQRLREILDDGSVVIFPDEPMTISPDWPMTDDASDAD